MAENFSAAHREVKKIFSLLHNRARDRILRMPVKVYCKQRNKCNKARIFREVVPSRESKVSLDLFHTLPYLTDASYLDTCKINQLFKSLANVLPQL